VINRKKVRRLMARNGLLNHSYSRHCSVCRVVESKVNVSAPNRVWELDIKYVSIAGEEMSAYFPGFHCNGGDVRETMFHALHDKA
jgi:hypothetical protein